jgi:putative DNA primase/helicase
MSDPAALRIIPGEKQEVREPGDARPPEFSDEALALTFAERHADKLRFVAKWSEWMLFDGERWVRDETRLAFNMARAICREAAAEHMRQTNKPKGAQPLASAKTRAAVVVLANDDRRLAATADQWDVDSDVLNTPREPR